MLYSIYHMTAKLLLNRVFACKMRIFCHYTRRYYKRNYLALQNLKTTSGLSILKHDVISLPDATSCDKVS